jgi:hypothetical protein
MRRRAVALLAAGLLLQLNAWQVLRDCEPAHQVDAGAVDHSQHQDYAPAPDTPRPQPDQPCCAAMTVCTSTLAVGAVVVTAEARVARIELLSLAQSRYRGVIRAPEPPPPRHEAV